MRTRGSGVRTPRGPTSTESLNLSCLSMDDATPHVRLVGPSATQRALRQANVDSTLTWYNDEHAFIPAFYPSMDRIITYFERQ